MNRSIDPARLRQIREQQGFTQDDLAAKSKLAKQTIHRIETGREKNLRPGTIKKICAALGVDAEVLNGARPLPPPSAPAEASEDSRSRVSVRIDSSVRNALSLVALRYKVPITRIVELAPFLFTVVAEESLQARTAKLEELGRAFSSLEGLQNDFPHLPLDMVLNESSYDAQSAEHRSIKNHDIFGTQIPNDIFWKSGPAEPHYDDDAHNPFVVHLKRLAASSKGAATIEYFGPRSLVSYQVCRADALAFVDGDEELAEGILNGWILLHEVPRDLLKKDAKQERIAWLRPRVEAARSASEKLFNELTAEQLQKSVEAELKSESDDSEVTS